MPLSVNSHGWALVQVWCEWGVVWIGHVHAYETDSNTWYQVFFAKGSSRGFRHNQCVLLPMKSVLQTYRRDLHKWESSESVIQGMGLTGGLGGGDARFLVCVTLCVDGSYMRVLYYFGFNLELYTRSLVYCMYVV